jgi:uncharacterized protein (DUF4415 family)
MKKKSIIEKSKIKLAKPSKNKVIEIVTSDIPELDQGFFKRAQIMIPKSKEMVSMRLDDDVLSWFIKQEKN